MCGQFDLKVFDEVPTTDLIDTKDTNIASATSTSFKMLSRLLSSINAH